MSTTKRTFYVALALFTVIMVAYSFTWQCDFIDYDDNSHVFENEHVRAGLTLSNVAWAFTHFHASQWIPLTWTSFMADISLFGMEPGPLHLVNVLVHYLNTLLLFGVLWRLTRAYWRSAMVAALFAVHPINVETVAWITERKSLLNTFFWLLAIDCHIRYARTSSSRWIILTTVCMALGLMTKAMIVTLPFTLLLLDGWPLRRFATVPWIRLVIEKTPLFALTLVGCIIQIKAGRASNLLWPAEMAPIPLRVFGAAENILDYLGILLCPVKLSIRYPVSYEVPYLMGAVSVALFGTLITIGWLLRGRSPYLLVGTLWYLGTIFPVSGIVRAGDASFADRYTYVPQIGIFIVLVWSAGAILQTRWRLMRPAMAGATLAVLTCLTTSYVANWTNTITLFTYATETWPTACRAHEILANTASRMKKWTLAEKHYRAALELQPRVSKNRNSYGVSLSKQGKREEAILQFRRAIIEDPAMLSARFNLGTHLAVWKGGSHEAVALLRQLLEEDASLTVAHYWIGKALEAEGRVKEAEKAYRKRLEASPTDPLAIAAVQRLCDCSLPSAG